MADVSRKYMRSLILIAIAVSITIVTGRSQEPPPGYILQELKSIDGKVLMPKDWFFSTEKGEGENHFAYRLTAEDITAHGGFKTGLTINVYTEVPKLFSVTASEYAKSIIVLYSETGQPQDFKPPKQNGNFIVTRVELLREMVLLGNKTNTRIVLTTIANDKTGTVYAFIFGTPESDWEENRKILMTMSNVDLDPKK